MVWSCFSILDLYLNIPQKQRNNFHIGTLNKLSQTGQIPSLISPCEIWYLSRILIPLHPPTALYWTEPTQFKYFIDVSGPSGPPTSGWDLLISAFMTLALRPCHPRPSSIWQRIRWVSMCHRWGKTYDWQTDAPTNNAILGVWFMPLDNVLMVQTNATISTGRSVPTCFIWQLTTLLKMRRNGWQNIHYLFTKI